MPSPKQGEKGVQQLTFIVYNRPSFQALATSLTSLAVLLTIARLIRRFRIRRLSWDDAWAALSMLLVAVFLGVYWDGTKFLKDQRSLHSNEYKTHYKTWSLITMGLYTAIVWCSRISLSLSIARILPPGRLRRSTVCLAIFCFLAGASLPFLKARLCTRAFELQNDPTARSAIDLCPRATGIYLAALQITGDVVSSVLLVAIPVYFLRSTALPTSERRLILTLFASTVLALAVSILHVVFILTKSAGVVLSIHLQVCLGLTLPELWAASRA
ncbi:hypothetical protein PM082_014088 [Marasmius tenuissimus]|nr:hypothetical protein PM082_014088 [Marasmius tenuissimus]